MNEESPCATTPGLTKVRVWDLPTRVFHWVLVLCVVGQAITGSLGGNAMVWHFRFGYGVLTLLLFRLIWGLVGGRWSRFAAFIFAPQSVVNYIRGQGKPSMASATPRLAPHRFLPCWDFCWPRSPPA